MYEEIINALSSLEHIIDSYDEIRNEASYLRKEHVIISGDDMRVHLAKLAEENRLLHIGIVGRVKSGKSSLLNSIFFDGKSILPKAATPMTAALTVLTYGEKYSVKVEYFSAKDLEIIKKEHAEYLGEWERLRRKKEEDIRERAIKRGEEPNLDKAKSQADHEMKDNLKYVSFELYEHMKNSGVQAPEKNEEVFEADNLDKLMDQLNEYVGVKGKMMSYTKSVILYFPHDTLRDICVVDTPGINDPVRSREERTEEYLKNCNVVFILSPAGQFLTDQDLALMDRISFKEGIPIHEIYIIASQLDLELYGSIKEETNSCLNDAIKKINTDLASRSKDILSLLIRQHPEVKKQFDQLKYGGEERVMLCSAMCHSISLRYDDPSSWDEEMSHVWTSLKEAYPDYFDKTTSAKTSFALLSGINKLNEKIELVRKEKDRIIVQQQANFAKAQSNNVKEYIQELISEVKNKIELIRKSDIATIKKQKKFLEQTFSIGSEAVDDSFSECVEDFMKNIRNLIKKNEKLLFQQTKDENAKVEQSEIKIGTRYKHSWFDGLINFGEEKYSYETRTLRTGVVKSSINNLISNLNDLLNYSIREEKDNWKKSVPNVVTQVLISAVKDMELIDFANLKKAVKFLVNSIEIPDLNMDLEPFNSSYNATIEGDAIESFIDEVLKYMDYLKKVFDKTRDSFLAAIRISVEHEKLSKMIFSELGNQLNNLENEIQNKELTLSRLKRCLSELESLNL
jgi:predicted GTPase